jgi:VPS62-like protein
VNPAKVNKLLVALVVVLSAVIAVLLLVIVLGHKKGSSLVTDQPSVNVPRDQQRELAARFRPVLLFDSKEPWRPLNVDHFLSERGQQISYRHQLCQRGGSCALISSAAAFQHTIGSYLGAGRNFYIDIDGTQPNGTDATAPPGECSLRPPLRDCNSGPPTAIYYNVTGAPGRYFIDYWWFFRYNDFPKFSSACTGPLASTDACGDHEGDWEGVTVAVASDDPDQLLYTSYAAHDATYRYSADAEDLEGQDRTRPVVYVAEGTHASYPVPCKSDCSQVAAIGGVHLPDGDHDGLAPWGRNTGDACGSGPESCLRHLPSPTPGPNGTWDSFAGLWGGHCDSPGAECPLHDGPQTPARQARYLSPWCASLVDPAAKGAKFTCDAPTPGTGAAAIPGLPTEADCEAWAGVGVSVLACDAQTLASTLAADDPSGSGNISIDLDGEDSGVTATRGVSQVLGSPLTAGKRIVVEGRISNLLVRARGSGTGATELEFDYSGLSVPADGKATARVSSAGGRPSVTLEITAGGKRITVTPTVVHEAG